MLIRKPRTVAEAMAPFKKIQADLGRVIETATAAKDAARAEVVAQEQKARAAQGEVNAAQRALAQVRTIVGEAE